MDDKEKQVNQDIEKLNEIIEKNEKELEEPEPINKLYVTVVCQNVAEVFTVDESCLFEQIKIQISQKLHIEEDRILLIHNGKSLEDDEKVLDYSKESCLTVYLITKTPKPESNYNFPGLIGLGSLNWIEIQQKLKKELNTNPDLLKSMLNNPLVNSLMAKPEALHKLITKNSHLKPLLHRNKELSRMFKHPHLLEPTKQMAKSSKLREQLLTGRSQISAEGNWWERVFPQQSSQDLMQKIIENTNLTREMLLAPYTNPMLNALTADPSLASNLLGSSPIFKMDPRLRKKMKRFLPQFLQQIQHPDIKHLITTEKALKAVVDIEDGVKKLKQNVPDYQPLQGANSREIDGECDDEMEEEGEENVLSQFMAHMMPYLNQQTEESVFDPPEKQFEEQIEMLKGMGFNNKEEYLKSLITHFGNVDETVLKCLQK